VETTTVKNEEKNIRDKPDELARWVGWWKASTRIGERACARCSTPRRGRPRAEADASWASSRLHYIL